MTRAHLFASSGESWNYHCFNFSGHKVQFKELGLSENIDQWRRSVFEASKKICTYVHEVHCAMFGFNSGQDVL